MKYLMLLAASVAMAGCVTIDTVGSRPWYNYRMFEIESARAAEQIDEESYLQLRNEVDRTRADYIESIRSRYHGHYGLYFGHPYYSHHYYGHHGHHFGNHHGHD